MKDEILLECVKVILKKWIGSNREQLKDLTIDFGDSDALSKSKKS